MKRRSLVTITVFLLVSMFFGACHKKCVCFSFNGSERTYTRDEVDALGGSCTGLELQANTRLYSYCQWE